MFQMNLFKYQAMIINRVSSVLVLTFFCVAVFSPQLHADEYNTDPGAYVLKKFESHDIVLLGIIYKQSEMLNFVSTTIPELADADVSYVCLGISSEQQDRVNHYIQTGGGLLEIQINASMNCQGYRRILETMGRLHKTITLCTIGLPDTSLKDGISRDEYMAQGIIRLYRDNPGQKILVVLGNLYVFKKLPWNEKDVAHHKSVVEYLQHALPGARIFSIGQVNGHTPGPCNFNKVFSPTEGPVAFDCTRFSGWRLEKPDAVARETMEVNEAFDGVIVY